MASPWHMWALALLAPMAQGQVDNPSAADFYRRGYHTSEVLGNYLYVDGGFVSQVTSGNASRRVNSTLSLSLTTSWSNETVSFQTISKASAGAPDSSLGALWKDEGAGVLYSWAGTVENDVDGADLWKLTPDGAGGGTWSIETTSNSDSIDHSIIRTASGTGVACKGWGFYLGGKTTPTDMIPTWLKYNMSTQVWKNDSSSLPADIFPGDKTYQSGTGVCLPNYGENGVVMFLGGSATGARGEHFNFQNVTFYDIAADKWHGQAVPLPQTDSVPKGRELSCAVAVAGPNGTYDIFMHGGIDESGAGLSDTWILTLPAFRWIRVPLTSPTRTVHSCSLVGKSQMLIVGGVEIPVAGGTFSWGSVDPLKQGLGIIDLPSLSWSDAFNADAADYTPPQPVADIYSNGFHVDWDGDNKSIFMSASATSSSASSGTSSSSGSSTGNASESTSESTSTSSVGAIAGGVVGGIAVLCIAGALIFLYLKRRRRSAEVAKDHQRTSIERKATGGVPNAGMQYGLGKPEMAGDWVPSELSGSLAFAPQEMPSDGRTTRNLSERPYEMS